MGELLGSKLFSGEMAAGVHARSSRTRDKAHLTTRSGRYNLQLAIAC